MWVAVAKVLQGRASILRLALAMGVLALAQVHAPIIETQNYCSGLSQASRNAIHHLVVHGPAMLWMRMADQGRLARLGIFGRFEQSLQAARRTINEDGFDFA